MSVADSPSDPVVVTKSKPKDETRTRRVPPYNVILENDDHHSFEFVVEVLCKALAISQAQSYQFTLHAHHTGRAIVWTGPKEVAELKVEQISTFHEVRAGGESLGPVSCVIEPAPG
jgi:ATP-dependent Clp protease adaptor protein ClpS